jgi:hypothetical protein
VETSSDTLHEGQLAALGFVGRALALVAAVSQYSLAPATALQLKVGVLETPALAFAGEINAGAGSSPCADVCATLPDRLPVCATVGAARQTMISSDRVNDFFKTVLLKASLARYSCC